MADLTSLTDIEAERAVLGAVLWDPVCMPTVDLLKPTDFHDEGHQLLFSTLREMYTAGEDIEPNLVLRRIGPKAAIVKNGSKSGLEYLVYLGDAAIGTHSVAYLGKWTQIVSRLSTLRGMVGVAQNIATLAYNTNGDHIEDVFAKARALVDRAAPVHTTDWLLLWEDSIMAFFNQQLDRALDKDEEEAGIARTKARIPWAGIARFVPWLREGQLAVVAAEPGVGKTTMMEGMAEHWAKQGLRAVFFHLELSRRMMLDRRMVRHSGIDMRLIEDGFIDTRTDDASKKFQSWPGGIDYIHCPGWSAARIVSTMRDLAGRGRCDVAVIDYMQKLRLAYAHGANRAQAFGTAIETIKNALEQLGIPGVIGSQFSKKSRDRAIKLAADIRDTGELEDKCNVMLLLDRPLLTRDLKTGGQVIAETGTRTPETTVRAAKNTNGPEGVCSLWFQGNRFAFGDVETKVKPLNF